MSQQVKQRISTRLTFGHISESTKTLITKLGLQLEIEVVNWPAAGFSSAIALSSNNGRTKMPTNRQDLLLFSSSGWRDAIGTEFSSSSLLIFGESRARERLKTMKRWSLKLLNQTPFIWASSFISSSRSSSFLGLLSPKSNPIFWLALLPHPISLHSYLLLGRFYLSTPLCSPRV